MGLINGSSDACSSNNEYADEMRQCMGVLQSQLNMPLRENEKVYIKWNNINYFVPEL